MQKKFVELHNRQVGRKLKPRKCKPSFILHSNKTNVRFCRLVIAQANIIAFSFSISLSQFCFACHSFAMHLQRFNFKLTADADLSAFDASSVVSNSCLSLSLYSSSSSSSSNNNSNNNNVDHRNMQIRFPIAKKTLDSCRKLTNFQ